MADEATRPPPSLALIADGFTDAERAERVRMAVEGGVRWVHLRDHAASSDVFDALAQVLAEELRRVSNDVLITVNGRLATAIKLDMGIHLGRHGPSVEEARRRLESGMLIGKSVHDLNEGKAAKQAAVDYCFFSPIFPTRSKPGHEGVGLQALRIISAALPQLPVLALGGIRPENVRACLNSGAYGVAVLSGILDARDPALAAAAYRAALQTGDV